MIRLSILLINLCCRELKTPKKSKALSLSNLVQLHIIDSQMKIEVYEKILNQDSIEHLNNTSTRFKNYEETIDNFHRFLYELLILKSTIGVDIQHDYNSNFITNKLRDKKYYSRYSNEKTLYRIKNKLLDLYNDYKNYFIKINFKNIKKEESNSTYCLHMILKESNKEIYISCLNDEFNIDSLCNILYLIESIFPELNDLKDFFHSEDISYEEAISKETNIYIITYAVANNDIELFKSILNKQEILADTKKEDLCIYKFDIFGRTPLIIASIYGRSEMIKILFKYINIWSRSSFKLNDRKWKESFFDYSFEYDIFETNALKYAVFKDQPLSFKTILMYSGIEAKGVEDYLNSRKDKIIWYPIFDLINSLNIKRRKLNNENFD